MSTDFTQRNVIKYTN